MKQALTILMDEHRHIELACGVLDKMAKTAQNNGSFSANDWEKITDFIKGFADQCHHAKEEDKLFKMMAELGVPVENGPIAVMLNDHETGRSYVRGMVSAISKAKSGDKKALTELVENAKGYISLLPEHIWKEDNILYPIADSVLSDEENEKLIKLYQHQEHEKVGHGKHEEYLRTLAELAEKYGVTSFTPQKLDQCFTCHGHQG